MSDRVLIVVPGLGTLALDVDTYQAALAEGSKLRTTSGIAQVSASNESLLDAEQLAKLLQIPETWIEQKAREGIIPCIEFGRWRRFRRSEVESSVRTLRGI